LSTLSRIHYLFSYFSLAKFRVANEMMSISTSDINGIEDIVNRLTAIITNQIDSLNISVKKAENVWSLWSLWSLNENEL
jgi:hypothetical protein